MGPSQHPLSRPAVDPFALVADELTSLSQRMRRMVASEVPKLASAADYFFRVGAQGKRFRPAVVLLMASSLELHQAVNAALASSPSSSLFPSSSSLSPPTLSSPLHAMPAEPRAQDSSQNAHSSSLHPHPPNHSQTTTPTTSSNNSSNSSSRSHWPGTGVALQASSGSGRGDAMSGSVSSAAGRHGSYGVRPSSESWMRDRQRRIAEITEMIHVASLLHDDVLDHSEMRRGVSSLNHLVGNKLAVLAGDFLLARSSSALAALRSTEVVELMSAVLEDLVGGEVMQMTASASDSNTETDRGAFGLHHYLRKTFLKTASLIAHGCQAVAVLGEQPPAVVHLAFSYGRHLGMAFQLVDDALDFSSSSLVLGKPALNDIQQGLITGPVLFAAQRCHGMRPLMERRFSRPGDVEQAVAWVHEYRGVQATQRLAAFHSSLALQAVQQLPPATSAMGRQSREGLVELVHRVVNRKK